MRLNEPQLLTDCWMGWGIWPSAWQQAGAKRKPQEEIRGRLPPPGGETRNSTAGLGRSAASRSESTGLGSSGLKGTHRSGEPASAPSQLVEEAARLATEPPYHQFRSPLTASPPGTLCTWQQEAALTAPFYWCFRCQPG